MWFVGVGRCNLDFFHQCHLATIESTDPDRSQGELTVDLPLQTIPIIKGKVTSCLMLLEALNVQMLLITFFSLDVFQSS